MKEKIIKFCFHSIYFIKKQFFKTQLINTEHSTQDTDTGHRTQTHVKNILVCLYHRYTGVPSFLRIFIPELYICFCNVALINT